MPNAIPLFHVSIQNQNSTEHSYSKAEAQNTQGANTFNTSSCSSSNNERDEIDEDIEGNDAPFAISFISPNEEISNTIDMEIVTENCHNCHELVLHNRKLHSDNVSKGKKIQSLDGHINALTKKIQSLEAELKNLKKSSGLELVGKLFRPDQLMNSKSNSPQSFRYSNETIKDCLKIRLGCGISGYEMLRQLGYPFPSNRTLLRRVQHINFEGGILHDVFKMLHIKIKTMPEPEKFCTLTFDETELKQAIEYDLRSDSFLGHSTLPNSEGDAVKCLVFMLTGAGTVRWKQIVSFYFTPSSYDGQEYVPILLEIRRIAKSIGLNCFNSVCDMGSQNQAMWR